MPENSTATSVATLAAASPEKQRVADAMPDRFVPMTEATVRLGRSYDSLRRDELNGKLVLTRLSSRCVGMRESEINRVLRECSQPRSKQKRPAHFDEADRRAALLRSAS